uniref:Uncharacterized protein n=1 Tax=Rhabditophanes sp. KR3021 TaxID=114890 RepID=A0AC35TUZ1_9BILA
MLPQNNRESSCVDFNDEFNNMTWSTSSDEINNIYEQGYSLAPSNNEGSENIGYGSLLSKVEQNSVFINHLNDKIATLSKAVRDMQEQQHGRLLIKNHKSPGLRNTNWTITTKDRDLRLFSIDNDRMETIIEDNRLKMIKDSTAPPVDVRYFIETHFSSKVVGFQLRDVYKFGLSLIDTLLTAKQQCEIKLSKEGSFKRDSSRMSMNSEHVQLFRAIFLYAGVCSISLVERNRFLDCIYKTINGRSSQTTKLYCKRKFYFRDGVEPFFANVSNDHICEYNNSEKKLSVRGRK